MNNVYDVIVRTPDRKKFVEGVCEWAAKGAEFTGETPRLNKIPFSARFKYKSKSRIEVGRFGNYIVLEDWVFRTQKELEGMQMLEIQKLATKYNLTGRDKALLIRDFLKAQSEYAKEQGYSEDKVEDKVKQVQKKAEKTVEKVADKVVEKDIQADVDALE